MNVKKTKWAGLAALAGVSMAMAEAVFAQDPVIQEPTVPDPAAAEEPIEEVVVLGRFKAAATDIVSERLESDVPVDLLDAALISRVGDSNVASALRRVPGVTLVQDQFVYVRGLGERYSSTQLNGSVIPSPDLTRNVLPLNIFPAEIIDALSVTKGYSPDLPAAFGGGNINIRTKAIPEDAQFSVSLNTGWNSEHSNDGFSYAGGDDDNIGEDDGTRALPQEILSGIEQFRGSFSPNNIQRLARQSGSPISIADAQLQNRTLATSLNRNLDLSDKSLPADFEGEVTGGYRWFLGDDWDLGFLALADYSNKWRNRQRTFRRVTEPEQTFANANRTINQVTVTGGLNVGLNFLDDHEISVLGLFLRNTEDEATVAESCTLGQFNDCETTNNRERIQDTRFEQRDLEVLQVSGEHALNEDTFDEFPFLNFLRGLEGASGSWFYTESTAETDLPNETRVKFVEDLDPTTGQPVASRVRAVNNAAEFRFGELTDDVENYGGQITVPFAGSSWDLELSGGGMYTRKGRSYRQTIMGLGPSVNNPAFNNDIASGSISDVFSDSNLTNPAYGYELFVGIGQFGTESYAAGQITEAGFGKFDLMLGDAWRFSGGARWENFKQLSVPIDYLEFDGPRIPLTADEIENSTITTDEWYPALSATYIRPDFWAPEFQFRASWSETATRPDIREISSSVYIDPLTEARVIGNPNLKPAALTNFDLRAEWFWDADNFTVSAFYKDIEDPIETIQGGATEDNIVFNFINADSAEVYGIEFEGLKGLGFLSNNGWTDAFYVAGNATFSDSEVVIPATAGGNITNRTRALTQQSPWVANVQLGYDSFDGRHGATLVYNAFGERIFFAGINGVGDAFEQPFHSLDFVYTFFPSDLWTIKLRFQNILDQTTRIDQQDAQGNNVRVIEQTVGTSFLLDVKWGF
ncbi:MAG: TonB-dependent receptor [Woeseiaceae bacterium]|nr:TonB-dependent receptor [Woeseiaceae bacterium]